jgi:hypothetical protein
MLPFVPHAVKAPTRYRREPISRDGPYWRRKRANALPLSRERRSHAFPNYLTEAKVATTALHRFHRSLRQSDEEPTLDVGPAAFRHNLSEVGAPVDARARSRARAASRVPRRAPYRISRRRAMF